MLDWYKLFDRETFMEDFSLLDFRKFNPFYKLEWEHQDQSLGEARVESIFEDSNSFSQMFY